MTKPPIIQTGVAKIYAKVDPIRHTRCLKQSCHFVRDSCCQLSHQGLDTIGAAHASRDTHKMIKEM